MYELIISNHFSSAHYLRGYKGACEKLHGHTWKVEVAISGATINDIGLVMDFRDLKSLLGGMVDYLDHECLNELPEFQDINPSTENMARYFYQKFQQKLPEGIVMKHARIWESDSASVKYSE